MYTTIKAMFETRVALMPQARDSQKAVRVQNTQSSNVTSKTSSGKVAHIQNSSGSNTASKTSPGKAVLVQSTSGSSTANKTSLGKAEESRPPDSSPKLKNDTVEISQQGLQALKNTDADNTIPTTNNNNNNNNNNTEEPDYDNNNGSF
jgi:hypothetical protein